MDDEEEKLFLERLTLKVWKTRAEGAIIGAAFVLGIGFLLYLVRCCVKWCNFHYDECSNE